MLRTFNLFFGITLFLLSSMLLEVQAQTDNDAIMMNKQQWCNGITYDHAQWNNYWEGTFKRDNHNIGTLTTQSVMFMSNYGISDNLNLIASVPYIWTDASAGTLHGMRGFQDLSMFLKWKPISFNLGRGKLSLFAILGFSTPTNNYDVELLPLSIGLGSTNIYWRGMVNYRQGIFFVRASATYVWRSNVSLDQNSYYTTQLYGTNQVQMPDMATFNGSVGIFTKYLVAEVMVDNMTTLGGFDIRKNDMPFISNRMNSTSLGAHIKYTFPFDPHVSVVGGMNYVVAGRNVGQTLDFNIGAFYAFYLSRHKTTTLTSLPKSN
jgi:hypothetical protein